ncbi:MAG: 50S ribosomal protein L15 [Gemmatimonadales bacterium]|nr:MAG: 50S ribosomal protein L15 [Gemmatimonadales bacterium]
MTELHDLRPSPGSHRNRKRVGRGPGSGTGKTSGRGQKGQKARSGASIPAGFEGGQMPLQRRIPKGGFTPLNRVEYEVVNVRTLQEMEDTDVSPRVLQARSLIGSGKVKLKILGTGDLSRAVHVHAHAFSASAREKIEAAGGSATVIGTDTDA